MMMKKAAAKAFITFFLSKLQPNELELFGSSGHNNIFELD